MTKQEATAAYAAYAELEAAAEAFYAAASKMGAAVPKLSALMNTASEDLNFVIVEVDAELDEVL